MSGKRTILLAISLAIGLALPSEAKIFVVDSTGDQGDPNTADDICGILQNDRNQPSFGPCTLRAAIQTANANSTTDIIQFSIPASEPNCGGGGCFIQLTQVLPDLSTNLSLNGPGADKLTIRRGTGGTYRIFNVVTASAVTLSGLTVANGNTSSGGAGVLNGGATLNINGCIFADNFSSNSGGGIASAGGGTVNIVNSTISGNHAGGPTSTTTTAFSSGGGIVNLSGSTVTITNSTISRNIANLGGGGISNSGTLIISNSTISGNTAADPSTFGSSNGGGILAQSGSVNIKNTIVAGNTAFNSGPDVSGAFTSFGFNLIGKSDGSTGFTAATDLKGTNASPLDPKLDSGLRENGGPTTTLALLSGSPAIDKGSSNGLLANLTTDQRGTGFSRTVDDLSISNASGGDGTDIGAFEALLPSRLANISTRGLVGTSDDVLIAGMIIVGQKTQKVIVRAIGPSLSVPGKLENPTLELRDGNGGLLEANDDWINSLSKQAIIDSTIPPSNDLESAIVRTLTPASYTAIVRGVNNTTGIGLVEVYALN